MPIDINETIRLLALKNALKHDGKARISAVLGMFLSTHKEYRSKVKEIRELIDKTVQEINNLSDAELEALSSQLSPEIMKSKVEEQTKELPPLPNVENYDKVVMRLAPYPSGPLHIGNARMVILNDYYVKRYAGKLFLVFDDTIGSAIKDIFPESYRMIKEDLKYLDVEYHESIYKSDRVKTFYKYCEKLIEMNQAYVCTCEAEKWREKHKKTQIPCKHRSSSKDQNLEQWRKMLDGIYNEGDAVVRLKTGMKLDNPAIRDHVIMRISNKIHPRVGEKYKVWPLLEFSWAIDDHLLGITHIIRGKDLLKEDIIESKIWEIFDWPKAEFIHYGLISFKGLNLSKTEARLNIEKGVYRDWTDPRTWSIQSLKKRGILSESIRELIDELGLSLADIKLSPKKLYSINRSKIDSIADRYFFISTPKTLTIKNINKKELKAEVFSHPDFPERGERIFTFKIVNNQIKLYIDEKDAKKLYKNQILRLKDLVNIKIIDESKNIAEIIPGGIDEFRELSEKVEERLSIIHWLPTENNIKVDIILMNGKIISGIAENNCNNLKIDDIIQFERFGFCRIDQTKPKILAYYSHP
ncbi:MAG: glutamate--tRNA ligase [Candidatus Lokiarchaeota archaeon]|nr:glutamate--tRNA ligase [Candidatus Lokiarchaeota archaeon]